MRRKGAIFTFDALVALTLVTAAYLFVVGHEPGTFQQDTEYQQMHMTSSDAMNIITQMRLSDLNETLREKIINETEIDDEDLSRSIPDIMGKLWAYNQTGPAEDISREMFEEMIPEGYGYSVKIRGGSTEKVLYMSDSPRPMPEDSRDLVSSYRIISGYEDNIPSESYVASAWAVTAKKNSTKSVVFNLAGSGWYNENFTSEKNFEMPENATIYSAVFYISVHYYPDIEGIWVNDEYFSEDDIDWIHYEYSYGSGYGAYGTINSTALAQAIESGHNNVRIVMRNGEYHSHMHPGTMLKIDYETDELYEPMDMRFNLDRSLGYRAAWQIQPFHIPRGARINDIDIHIEGHDVDERAYVLMNEDEVYYTSSPGSDPSLDLGMHDVIGSMHVTQSDGKYYSTGETNMLSVYLDMTPEGDNPLWGTSGTCEIDNESYVEINYTDPDEMLKYGMIEVTRIEELGGSPERIKKANFSFPMWDITKGYLHVAEYYSWKIAAAVWNEDEDEPSWAGDSWDQYQIFSSPSGRSISTDIYVPKSRMNKGETNWVKVRDFDGSSANKILPESTFEYSFLVPSIVNYGDNFPTKEEAIEDANQRLEDQLGEYAHATTIDNEAISISQVPWMWGPAYLTFELWR